MSYKRYRGPIDTVEQAVFADMPVSIRCLSCGHIRRMHAFKLLRAHRTIANLKLREVVTRFSCLQCHENNAVLETPVKQV